MMRRLIVLGLAAGLALSSARAADAQEPRPEVRLADNVFLVPDRYAKSINGWLVIRAGCADEAETCTGIAHYLEHLLFINRDPDHRSKVSLFPAGNGNGWTTHSSTGYTQSFPVQEASKAADIDKLVGYLAGHLRDVRADEGQAARERNVVLQEILQRGNSPQARFGEKRTALLLPNDPLGKGVGGTAETIKSFDIPRAVAFQQSWYATNNAAFIFAGPLSAEDLKAAVEKHIAPLQARSVPERQWYRVAAPVVESKTLRDTDKDLRQPLVTYDKLIPYAEPEAQLEQLSMNSARNVVASFLSSRMAGSPLHEMIDKTELIATGGFGLQKIRPGMMRLSFSGTPAKGVTPERLSAAVKAYIDRLKPGRVTEPYLKRLKSRSVVGRELLVAEPPRYASSLVGWLQSPYTYEQWRDRASIEDGVDMRRINDVLRALAKPGREVFGFLNPVAVQAEKAP